MPRKSHCWVLCKQTPQEIRSKSKSSTPDNFVSVIAGISLAKAAGLKKQISHREMESYTSYKRHDYEIY